jgi:hypothetical protein
MNDYMMQNQIGTPPPAQTIPVDPKAPDKPAGEVRDPTKTRPEQHQPDKAEKPRRSAGA